MTKNIFYFEIILMNPAEGRKPTKEKAENGTMRKKIERIRFLFAISEENRIRLIRLKSLQKLIDKTRDRYSIFPHPGAPPALRR